MRSFAAIQMAGPMGQTVLSGENSLLAFPWSQKRLGRFEGVTWSLRLAHPSNRLRTLSFEWFLVHVCGHSHQKDHYTFSAQNDKHTLSCGTSDGAGMALSRRQSIHRTPWASANPHCQPGQLWAQTPLGRGHSQGLGTQNLLRKLQTKGEWWARVTWICEKEDLKQIAFYNYTATGRQHSNKDTAETQQKPSHILSIVHYPQEAGSSLHTLAIRLSILSFSKKTNNTEKTFWRLGLLQR